MLTNDEIQKLAPNVPTPDEKDALRGASGPPGLFNRFITDDDVRLSRESGITQLTGDVTAGPGAGSQAATLANTGVTPGSYTSTDLTVSADGRITAAANGTPGGGGTVTNAATLTSGKAVIGNGGVDVTVSSATGVAHLSGGTLSGSNVVESEITLANNTTNDVSTSAHGFAPIAPNDATKFLNGANPPAWTVPAGTGALTWIEEQTPTGTSVTFSSLGSFTHLKLIYSARGDQVATSTSMSITINADGGSNYDRENISATTGTPGSTESLAQTSATIGTVAAASATAGFVGSGIIDFIDYRGTAFHKTGFAETQWRTGTGAGAYNQQSLRFHWRSTSAITSFTITLSAGNFVTGSKFTLYGMQ